MSTAPVRPRLAATQPEVPGVPSQPGVPIVPGALAVLAALVTVAAVAVAPLQGQGAGSGATTILRVAPGPVPLSLGNAYTAVRAPLAVEYNPGALSGPAQMGASYQALPVGATAGSAILAMPLGRGTVGLSLRFLDYGSVDVVAPSASVPVGERTGEMAGGGELSALLGASVPIGPLRVGAAARWLSQDVAGLSDNVFAVDAGLLLRVTDHLDVGASVQHLGPDLEAGRPAPLPRSVRVGAAARGRVAGFDVLLTTEAREREDRLGFGAGVELSHGWDEGAAALRLGYETRPDPGDAYSPLVVGGGIELGWLAVELAWRSIGPLGTTRQVGLRYRF